MSAGPSIRAVGLGGHRPGSQDGFWAAGSLFLLGLVGQGLGAKPEKRKTVEMIPPGQGEAVGGFSFYRGAQTGIAEPLGFPKLILQGMVHGRGLVGAAAPHWGGGFSV